MSAIVVSNPTNVPFDPTPPLSSDDPYRIGWRDVFRNRPDGSAECVRIPLTAEDALHPREGDVILETDLHFEICAYLRFVLKNRLAKDPSTVVLSDVGIYWDPPELKHHSPDVAVIFGVRQRRDEWPSFHVADEGVWPHLIVEVVSQNTRNNDVVEKFRQYHVAKVPEYVIVDLVNGVRRLHGYTRTPTKYLAMPTDEDGRLWLDSVGIGLGIKGRVVACYDGVTGEEIGDYDAVVAEAVAQKARADAATTQAEVATARAEMEKARADAAEQRLRELEARLNGTKPE